MVKPSSLSALPLIEGVGQKDLCRAFVLIFKTLELYKVENTLERSCPKFYF